MDRQQAAAYLFSHPAELGRRLGFPDLKDELHGQWLRAMITAKEDFTLQSHRGSYKSTCLTIAIALLMVFQREKSILFLRKTDGDVAEIVTQIQHLLTAPLFQQAYYALTGTALSLLTSTKNEITTSAYQTQRGASQLLGIGLGGSLTGKHADIIITDDIVNRLDRTSRAERERTKQIYQELQNIKNRGGRFINTGTPWHKEDAFALMPAPITYDCYHTGLIDEKQLAILRQSMSPSLFAANYELRHIASDGALFQVSPATGADPGNLVNGIAHIDAAYGGEDYTAFTCAARQGGTLYLYGRLWRAHVDTVLDAILADCSRLLCAPVYCETNGDKGYLAKEIRRRDMPVRAYQEKQNKYLKISTYLRKWWGNVAFVQGTDPAYIAQVLDYTEDAEHDDAPDSAAVCCRILDKRGD